MGRESARERTGSSMSARQIAYAATSGRKVTVTPLVGEPISGYVCGQDDFHWLVAQVKGDSVQSVLVHKSAPTVAVSPVSSLEDEQPAVRAAVEGMGRGFWLFCDKTYFNKSDSPRQEQAS